MLHFTFYFFILIIIVQISYYLLIFGRFSFAKKTDSKKNQNIPISVIVCAKNEEINIQKYIPLLLQQNYLNFEIVLIDDASSDETLEIFEKFEKENKNVKLIKVQNNEAFWGNKKFALTLGIKSATYENLLFIDADCYPETLNWITEMSSHFNNDKTIILGHGAFEKVENSFLNKIIRFENLLTATQYFAWTLVGKPYMGVGRNLGYTKSEFFKTNGFINHMKIRSGDDDLFVNEAANSNNTSINYNWESFTYSKAKTTFKDWILQKRRHVATAKYYKTFDKMQLGLFYSSQLLFILLATVLLIFQFQWIIILILIAVRYLFSWLSLGYASGKLYEKDVMYFYPIIEIVLIFTQLHVFARNLISKPVHWK